MYTKSTTNPLDRYLRPIHLLLIFFTFPFYLSRSTFNINGGSRHRLNLSSRSLSAPSLFSPGGIGSVVLMTLSTQMVAECSSLHLSPRYMHDADPDQDTPTNITLEISSSSPRKTSRTSSRSTTTSSTRTLNPSPCIVNDKPTQSINAYAPMATQPTPTLSLSNQGKMAGCIDLVSSLCRYASLEGSYSPPQSGMPIPSSIQSSSNIHPTANGPESSITGPFSGNAGQDQHRVMMTITLVMMLMAAVAAIGVMIAGVVVLRKRRQKKIAILYGDDFIPYEDNNKRMRKTDQHVGLNSFSSTGTGLSELPQQQEQFWNA